MAATIAVVSDPVEILGLEKVPQVGDILSKKLKEKSASLETKSRLERDWEVSAKTSEVKLIIKADTYGSLEAIMKQLARLTNRYLILEFPTETDRKAIKWVNLPNRIKVDPYSESELKRCALQHFRSIRDIGRVSPHRPIFLMEKCFGT